MDEVDKAFKDIVEACKFLGWGIYFDAKDEDDNVDGGVIGTKEFIERVVK